MNIFCVSSEAFADGENPTESELDACTIAAYCAAWSARYGMECNEVQIDARGMSRIRSRLSWLAQKRRKQGETFGDSYRRTAKEAFQAWLAFDGRGGKWLVERYHPLQALADGMTKAPDADLNVASDAVLGADKKAAAIEAKRAAKEIELVRHVPGPEGRRALAPTKAPFAYALPENVRAELAVSNA